MKAMPLMKALHTAAKVEPPAANSGKDEKDQVNSILEQQEREQREELETYCDGGRSCEAE